MGKSGRHKKLNRAEKAKTQLKGGGIKKKTLAKAANVVNPTLRVKKIVIREQLAATPDQNEDVAITRRHQTLPELLSALHHHNTNLRKDALLGLLEIVTGQNNSIFLKRNLDKILERVAALTSDLEGVVRRENLKVAQAIFEKIEECEIQPFWNLILTHLQCTLTHLNPTVRYSTLPFFHLLVAHFPNLVAASGRSLLSAFLSLISSASLPGTKNTTTSHLKVEISGRKDEVQERLKVFALIDACLHLRGEKQAKDETLESCGVACHLTFSDDANNSSNRNHTPTSFELQMLSSPSKDPTTTTGLVYSFGYDSFISNNKNNSIINSTSISLADILNSGTSSSSSTPVTSAVAQDEKFWPTFAQSCLSCLTETWIESSPSSSSSSSSMTLASTTLEPSRKQAGSDKKKCPTPSPSSPSSLHQAYHEFLNRSRMDGNDSSITTSVNLPPTCVDTLKNLVSVMVQIIMPHSKVNTSGEDGDTGRDEFIEVIRTTRGADLRKHFFSHLPYVSITESNKQILTTINLNLFCIAAHLLLMDDELMTRFETLIDELIQGGTLDLEQIQLIIRFLSCSAHPDSLNFNSDVNMKKRKNSISVNKCNRTSSLSTDFISCVLSSKHHRREMCKYLQRVLRPDNTNGEEIALIQSLDWDILSSKLVWGFSRISFKWLNLLTHIVLRKLSSSVRSQLVERLQWFEVQLNPSNTPTGIWNEAIRLFWYADALDEFKKSFDHKKISKLLPKDVQVMLTTLECH